MNLSQWAIYLIGNGASLAIAFFGLASLWVAGRAKGPIIGSQGQDMLPAMIIGGFGCIVLSLPMFLVTRLMVGWAA